MPRAFRTTNGMVCRSGYLGNVTYSYTIGTNFCKFSSSYSCYFTNKVVTVNKSIKFSYFFSKFCGVTRTNNLIFYKNCYNGQYRYGIMYKYKTLYFYIFLIEKHIDLKVTYFNIFHYFPFFSRYSTIIISHELSRELI